MLDRTKQLLSQPDATNPRVALANVLRAAAELLSLPDNDFAWSSWADHAAAVAEIEAMLVVVEAGDIARPNVCLGALRAYGSHPGGESELRLGDAFLKLAERYDRAERLLWP